MAEKRRSAKRSLICFKPQILGINNFYVLDHLTTTLNHKTCINTSGQSLKKTLITINAVFTQDNNLSKTKEKAGGGLCRKQTLHARNEEET